MNHTLLPLNKTCYCMANIRLKIQFLNPNHNDPFVHSNIKILHPTHLLIYFTANNRVRFSNCLPKTRQHYEMTLLLNWGQELPRLCVRMVSGLVLFVFLKTRVARCGSQRPNFPRSSVVWMSSERVTDAKKPLFHEKNRYKKVTIGLSNVEFYYALGVKLGF